MTRTEFARVVADKMKNDYPDAGIGYQDAKIWTVAVFNCLAEEVLRQDKVTLMNFGTFEKYTTKERRRGDINNKTTMVDPPRVKLKFTIAEAMDKKMAKLPVNYPRP